jgi:predicted adenine nucleotide alpha hydrolase (AANH) superfamily ATPase
MLAAEHGNKETLLQNCCAPLLHYIYNEMNNQFEYGFWFWTPKLNGILTMLSYISDYDYQEYELDAIQNELRNTNDEKEIWGTYSFIGRKHRLDFTFAYDDEEGEDMIHFKIKAPIELKEKLEMVNTFQSLFRELEI